MKKNINLNLVNSQIHESAELNPSSHVIDSIINENSKIYKDCWVVKSKMECDTFIGDGTKIDNSRLDSFSRTGKYNHLYHTELGRHTYTGQDTIIMHSTIGSFSSISWGVTIGGGEHDFNRFTSHSFLYNNYDKLNNNVIYYDRFKKTCEVGNDVWIGANATILRGVKVGNGAVIGANAVVTKDVPPYAIVAGNPATIVKFRFAKEIIKKLNELKWWDCEDEFIKDNINLFAEEPTGKNIEEIERKINSMRGCQK